MFSSKIVLQLEPVKRKLLQQFGGFGKHILLSTMKAHKFQCTLYRYNISSYFSKQNEITIVMKRTELPIKESTNKAKSV